MCSLKEGDLIDVYQTVYANDYNNRRFLQENNYPIAMHARNEPYRVRDGIIIYHIIS